MVTSRALSMALLGMTCAAGPLAAAPAALFTPIDSNFSGLRHIVPASPIKSAILLRAQVDTVTTASGVKALARENNDFTGYVPIDGRSDSGYVIVNNETFAADPVLGDGGGMTVFTAHFKDSTWKVAEHPNGRYREVDFSGVGGTIANCGGGMTPWGTVLTAEESLTSSNADLYKNGAGFRDTSDWTVTEFNGLPVNRKIKRFQHMNLMVEVDVAQARAIRKYGNMGRFDHEIGYSMPDGKTLYFGDDSQGGVFFKFISDTVGNYRRGQLYAYRQSPDGDSGSWIPMSMDMDYLFRVRDRALEKGATFFHRLEWVTAVDGKVYLSETGFDNSGLAARNVVRAGATMSRHLAARLNPDSTINDYFGRILRFDTATNKLDVLLEGGLSADGATNFSNPDCLTSVTLEGKTYLVVCEDLVGLTQGRVPPAAQAAGRLINELFWLDLSIAKPKIEDLQRMVVGPFEAELTGVRFTPDGRTMFVNVQHPSRTNATPYNTSYTLAVWDYFTPSGPVFARPRFPASSGKIEVQVNASSRKVDFSRLADVSLYNARGDRLEQRRKILSLDIAGLAPGTYYLSIAGQAPLQLILQ